MFVKQTQLNQIANGLKELSKACEYNFGRIIQGQRDDRLAKLFWSRSTFIQAISLSDEDLKRQMLINAINAANVARAELAFQIRSDIFTLSTDKNLLQKIFQAGEKVPNAGEKGQLVQDINIALVAMNNAVQLALYAYQFLGEFQTQLVVVKEHEKFINQVLVREIDYKGIKISSWRLICSSATSGTQPHDILTRPNKLIANCSKFLSHNTERN